MGKKVEFIEQSEHSECGITSVTMVLNNLGKKVNLSQLRDLYGVPKGGNTLFHLKSIFREFGVDTVGLKIDSLDFFEENNRPCVLFWDKKHYVVFERKTKNKIIIVDPALGRKKYSFDEFWEHFSLFGLVVTGVEEDFELPVEEEKPQNILFNILKTQRGRLVGLIALTLAVQGLGMGIPIVTQRLVDNHVDISQKLTHMNILALVGLVFISYYALQVSRNLIITKFQIFFDKNLMTSFMKKIMVLPLNFFVNRSTGDLIFRSNLTTYIQQILSSQLVTTVIDVIFVFAYFTLMLSYSVQLTMITLVAIAVIIISSLINSKKFQALTDQELILHSRVHRTLVELFEGMETVKSIGAEKQFYDSWEKNFDEQLDVQMKKSRTTGWIGNIAGTTQFILPILITGLGVYGLTNRTLTIGELISFSSISMSFVIPIVTLLGSYSQLLVLRSYFGKLSEILEQKSVIDDERTVEIAGYNTMELKDVNFQYSKFEPAILSNINLRIGEKEKVAIVGPSGSGKSTLLKVIAGLYAPTDGQVLLNGENISEIKQASVREKISVVNQNPTIFNLSLRDNILMNSEGVAEEVFLQAAQDSRVEEITKLLPMGYETLISEGGMNLSGGQMQRIAIARAMVKQPELMLMDEPTSALDNISENYIMNRIKDYECPCVVVSHRLNTIQHFDRVIVMNEGKIVEEGHHDELMKNKGLYSYIYSGNLEDSDVAEDESEGEMAVG